MRRNLKSQVTMIMIVGIVIFIVIGLVLYLSKTSVKKSQSSSKKIQTTPIEVQPIKDFVTNCIDKTSKDALILLGKQGGYAYASQGGTLVDFSGSDEGKFFIKYGQANVAYNIKPLSLYAPPPYSTSVPKYPWDTFPYGPLNPNTKTFKGLFGINNMPPLKASGGPHSIQSQIETYVDKNLAKCLDFKIFTAQGYEIKTSKITTKVLIGSKDIGVSSQIPLEITNIKTQEKTELKDFSIVIDARLKDLHYFIQELVENDIEDITFNIIDTKNNKDDFSIKVTENIYQNDDMISIKDDQSLVYGQPFEYIFARKNRFPALYYIKNPVINLPANYLIHQDDLIQDSELDAEDPDEDTTIINVEAQLADTNLPTALDRPQIKFRVTASDGQLEDYQILTVNRK